MFDSTSGLSHSEDKHRADVCPTGQKEAAIKYIVYLAVMLYHMEIGTEVSGDPLLLSLLFKS